MTLLMEELRKEIDLVDARIAEALLERFLLVQKIAAYKKAYGLPVFDPLREEEKIKAIRAMAREAAEADYLEEIYRKIMASSRAVEEAEF